MENSSKRQIVPKSLRQNSSFAFLRHWIKITRDLSWPNYLEDPICYFPLISNKYFNGFFKNVAVSIYFFKNDQKFSVSMEKYGISKCDISRNMSFVDVFLKMAELKCIKIKIFYGWQQMGKEKTRKWIEFCLKLKNYNSLEHIDLCIEGPNRIFLDILFDLLHKKIKTIFIDSKQQNIFVGSKLKLNEVQFWKCDLEPLNIMQIKSRQIILGSNNENVLMKFSTQERFKPNEWIKKLTIRSQFGCFDKYELAIKNLKEVNPTMELEIYDVSGYSDRKTWRDLNDMKECIFKIKQFIENVKLFIDMVQSEGMKISKIETKHHIRINNYGWSDEFSDKISTKLQLDGYEINKTFLYKGVEMKLEFSFNAYYDSSCSHF